MFKSNLNRHPATIFVLVVGVILIVISQSRVAAEPSLPATALPPGWEEIDPRFVFLTVRLASVETSIDAVNKGLKDAGYTQSNRRDDVAHAQKGNEIMDRNAGGPESWQQFYGKTAEKFFYHPVDKNSTYHTETSLVQKSPTVGAGGVQSGQGVPASQRPPQFDYIYRANNEARQRAETEIAKLAGKMEALKQRRRELAAEQSALWGMIAFRGVSSREFASKAIYRFELNVPGTTDAAKQRQEAIRAAADFIRATDHAIAVADSEIDHDADGGLAELHKSVTAAWTAANEKIIGLPTLMYDGEDINTPVGRFVAAGKRLPAVTKNIVEAQRLSVEGDRAGDEQRSQTFRGALQQSLFDCAANIFTANDCVIAMAKDWSVTPDNQKRVADTPFLATDANAAIKPSPEVMAIDQSAAPDVKNKTVDAQGLATNAKPSTGPSGPADAGKPRTLLDRLAGTKWVNSKGVSFEWTPDGKFLHGGKQLKCKVIGPLRLHIIFAANKDGKDHLGILIFDENLTRFKQTDNNTSSIHYTGKIAE